MRIHPALVFTPVLIAATVAPAFAQDAPVSLPTVQATGFVAECARPVLPSQRQVADWTGLQNFGQVYAARARLMAEIARACGRPGIQAVQVTLRMDPVARDARFATTAAR